jgi:hypothetical protein
MMRTSLMVVNTPKRVGRVDYTDIYCNLCIWLVFNYKECAVKLGCKGIKTCTLL